MNLLWFIVLTVLVGAVVLGALIAVAMRWANQLGELQECPVETTGRVIGKIRRQSRSSSESNHYIQYEYTDGNGRRRRRRMLVAPEAWASHSEGGPIAIVYSEKHPGISAPKYVLKLFPR